MATRREHFVTFHSPGTLFDEETTMPVAAWEPRLAMAKVSGVSERHGSKPYAFSFATKLVADAIDDGEGGSLQVAPKTVATSGKHYINGKLATYDDAVARNDENEHILRSNMHCNSWWIVCETRNSYRHTGIFKKEDVVVDADGNVLERGDAPKWTEYRALKDAEKERERNG